LINIVVTLSSLMLAFQNNLDTLQVTFGMPLQQCGRRISWRHFFMPLMGIRRLSLGFRLLCANLHIAHPAAMKFRLTIVN
jgi:hypothetical protein